MSKWHKTFCELCPLGCGLEILVEDNRMIKQPSQPGLCLPQVTQIRSAHFLICPD